MSTANDEMEELAKNIREFISKIRPSNQHEKRKIQKAAQWYFLEKEKPLLKHLEMEYFITYK